MQGACVMDHLNRHAVDLGVMLNDVEKQHRHLLAVPLATTPELAVVLELFDKTSPTTSGIEPFTEADRRTVEAAAPLAGHLVRHAVAERHLHTLLLDALSAAAKATERLQHDDDSRPTTENGGAVAKQVTERIRAGLQGATLKVLAPDETLRLAELISELSARHGPAVGRFAIHLLEGVDRLLRGEE
jgi:GAF domain-containing protein